MGLTDDLEAREQTHNEGRGGSYTAKRRPVRLLYSEFFVDTIAAGAREQQLKRWSIAKKEALISGDLVALKHQSRRRS